MEMNQITALIRKNLVSIKRGRWCVFIRVYFPVVFFVVLTVAFMQLYYPEGKYVRLDYSYLKSTIELSSSPQYNYHLSTIAVIAPDEAIGKGLIDFSRREGLCRDSDCTSYYFPSLKDYQERVRKRINPFVLDFIIEVLKNKNGDISFGLYSTAFASINQELNQISSNDLIPPGELFYESTKTILPLNTIQLFLAKYLIHYHHKQIGSKTLRINSMPMSAISSYTKTSIYLFSFLPIAYSLSLFFIFNVLLQLMAEEKKSQLKDLLFRNGVGHVAYFFGWSLTFLMIEAIPIALTALLLQTALFTFISFKVLFLFLIGFANGFFFIAFILHLLFKDYQTGQSVMTIMYVVTTLLTLSIKQTHVFQFVKLLFCLFPQTLLTIGFDILQIINMLEVDVDYELFCAYYNGFSLYSICFVYLIDTMIYVLICYLIIKVNNKGFSRKRTKPALLSDEVDFKLQEKQRAEYHQPTDTISPNRSCLILESISKAFRDVSAVKNFNVKLFKDEIFCLLGHKGAGKTTLFNLLGGKEKADKGNVFLNEVSLIEDRDFLYKSIAICSEDNILFPPLTIEEHFQLLSRANKRAITDKLMVNLSQLIDFNSKKGFKPSELTDGEKKRLCLALAMLKKSPILLLDEPTKGLDYKSRKIIWDYLKKNKMKRMIIATTNSLEEAEYLSDRIGIIVDGSLIASGTTSFVKSKYPNGIDIKLILDSKAQDARNRVEVINGLGSIDKSFNIRTMTNGLIICNYPSIPNELNGLFNYLSQIKEQHLIIDYTVATCSLDQTSMRSHQIALSSSDTSSLLTNSNNTSSDSKGISFCNELLLKTKLNVLSILRNRKLLKIQLLIALLSVILLLIPVRTKLNSLFHTQLNLPSTLDNSKGTYYSYADPSFEAVNYFNLAKYNRMSFNHSASTDNPLKQIDIEVYSNSKYHLEKSVMHITSITPNEIVIDLIYTPFMSVFLPASNNFLLSTFLRNEYGIETNLIETYSTVYPVEESEKYEGFYRLFDLMRIAFILIAMSGFNLLTALRDRITGMKNLLYLSGNRELAYWMSRLLADLFRMIFFLPVIIKVLIDAVTDWKSGLVVIITFLVANDMFAYLFSCLPSERKGQWGYYFVSYLGTLVICTVLFARTLLSDKSDVPEYNETMIMPLANLCYVLFALLSISRKNSANSQTEINAVLVRHLFVSLGHFIICALILCMIENGSKLCTEKRSSSSKDSAEKELLLKEEGRNKNESISIDMGKSLPISLNNSNKASTSNKALSEILKTLGSNGRIGLVGARHSGKSALLKALTKKIKNDSGTTSYSNGGIDNQYDVRTQKIGYCPQAETLFEFNRVCETLSYFAQLKGVHCSTMDLSKEYGLDQCDNFLCRELSLGNKRKLQLAIAAMNLPSILLLDEPTNGVDADSKLTLWRIIKGLGKCNQHCSMILATDSIEEAETLCDTILLMKDGSIAASGNSETIKLKLSDGYSIDIQFDAQSKSFTQLKQLSDKERDELKSLIDTSNAAEKANEFEKQLLSNSSLAALFDLLRELRPLCVSISLIPNLSNPSSFKLKCLPLEKHKSAFFIYLLSLKSTDIDHKVNEVSIKLTPLEELFNLDK